MTEIERLILQITTQGASAANRDLGLLNRNAGLVTGSIGKLTKGFGGLVASLGGIALIGTGLNKLKTSTETFQGLNAQLLIATKSADGASDAYGALTDFSDKYALKMEDTVKGFQKLVNLGLNPGTKAMLSYGNTATAMGKSTMDFIEAVADAATLEFERLKEFGIKSSQAGDKVTFTFQGASKTIGKSAAEIEKYLQDIGNNQFAGALEAKAKTLTGQITKLENTWDQLWIEIARTGPDNLITQAFTSAATALSDLLTSLKSGELELILAAQGEAWMNLWHDAETGLIGITTSVTTNTKKWEEDVHIFEASIKEVFSGKFPNYFADGIKKAAAWLDWFFEKFRLFDDKFTDQLKTAAERDGKIMMQIVSAPFVPGGMDSLSKDIQETVNTYNKVIVQKEQLYKKDASAADEAKDEILAGIDAVTGARNDAFDLEIAQANARLEKYKKEREARNKDLTDRTAKFKVGGDPVTMPVVDVEASKAAKAQREHDLADQLAFVAQGMAAENQVVADAYEGRKTQILADTTLTENQKKTLVLQALTDSVMTESEALRQAYETRRQFILSDTQLTEEQRTALMTKLTKAREEKLAEIERQNMEKRLSAASTFFSNIASIGSTFGKRGFEISKAAAIANATIDTYKAATGAYASLAGIPYIGPALGIAAAGAAIAAGAANIANIKSTSYSGAYAEGGFIPSGRFGIVGEAGPEFVHGPAVVTSAAASRAKMEGRGGSNIVVQNFGQPVNAEVQDRDGELLVILRPLLEETKKATIRDITKDIKKGGGPVSKSIEATYPVRRGGS